MTSGIFQPSVHEWRHECLANSTGQSASDRMSNGNIFVNVSRKYMYETDSMGNLIWQYSASTPKAFRYECDHPGIVALKGSTCNGSTSVKQKESVVLSIVPNPVNQIIHINGIPNLSNYTVSIYNAMGQVVQNKASQNTIDVSNYSNGTYLVLVSDGEHQYSQKVMVLK